MSVKIEVDDVVPCIYRFLQNFGYEKAASALEKTTDVSAKGGISNRKLLKVFKFYLKHHPDLVVEKNEEEEEEVVDIKPKIKSLNTKRKPAEQNLEEEIEEEENIVVKKQKKVKRAVEEEEEEEEKPKKQSKKSKKVEEEEEEEEEEKPKKQVKKPKKVVEEEEEEEEEDDKVKKNGNKFAIKEKSAADGAKNLNKNTKAAQDEEEEEEEETYNKKSNGNNGYGRFSYVDSSIIDGVPEFLTDNTFESKTKWGQGGDAFGEFGNERLKDTRGKGFKKEKTKLKNKQFHGGAGRIDPFVSNSIKL